MMILGLSVPVTSIFVIYLASNILIIQSVPNLENTLQQVHVIFRHGDRTPDKRSLYPTDPHLNDTYFPYGLGALTNLGKKQEYELGKSLRQRYDSFLGDLYLPKIQEAWSSSSITTKLSLQLVLTGLWPPNKEQTFINDFPWQPIEYEYKPFAEDELLGFPFLRKKCMNYLQEFVKKEISDEVRNYFKQNKEKIDHINSNSGLNITFVFQLYSLYFGLYAEEHNNRPLPIWTKTVYPEFLEDATIYSYLLQTATNNMLKVSGGPLVKKVLLEAKDKIEGITPFDEKKIFLYSGHEFNIVHLLRALKSYKRHVPKYSSHVIFELHKIDSKYGFKIYYQDTNEKEPKLLHIPGCEQFCPIDQFENLMSDVIPDSSFVC